MEMEKQSLIEQPKQKNKTTKQQKNKRKRSHEEIIDPEKFTELVRKMKAKQTKEIFDSILNNHKPSIKRRSSNNERRD